MANKQLLSVITPTLNASVKIESCLKSVISQKYKEIEHIIIDGGSTDNTIKIVKEFQSVYPYIRIISEKDDGIYDAMNKGIDIAQGEWVYFLGSDDTLFNESVFSSLEPLLNETKTDIIYGNVILSISGKKYDNKFTKIKLLRKNICHQAILTRKSIFTKIGKFETKYKALADWHFNMKWFNDNNIRHVYTDQVIACYFEDGYCFNNPDLKFGEDWDKNVADYFPLMTRIIYRLECGNLFGKIIKTYLE